MQYVFLHNPLNPLVSIGYDTSYSMLFLQHAQLTVNHFCMPIIWANSGTHSEPLKLQYSYIYKIYSLGDKVNPSEHSATLKSHFLSQGHPHHKSFFAGARQRPRGHLVPRIQQQPYLSGFLSLLYHFMNSAMPSCRLQCGLYPHSASSFVVSAFVW